MQYFNGLSAAEAVTYAPATGQPQLRRLWREKLLRNNPALEGKSFSTPIVTSGVTHALSLTADLFVQRGDLVLLPDKFWENYELLFGVRYQARLVAFPLFRPGGGFNVAGLRQSLESHAEAGKIILILNFPNNPTGYSLTLDEAEETAVVIQQAAEKGRNLLVISDDAYFGLFYHPAAFQQSLFARLAGTHERLLAVKVDGPTKEEFVWGFRTGMLTFGAKASSSDKALYDALEMKVAGAIRSAISNCSQPAQSVLAKALADQQIDQQRAEKKRILQQRAEKVWEVLRRPEFADLWEPYPFNAGYFMCLKLKGIDAEAFRKHLLDEHGVGVIADGPHDIRVAFSAVDVENIEELYSILATAARELRAAAASG
jgi:aspartate/methionine/tyrosine aminotransferase